MKKPYKLRFITKNLEINHGCLGQRSLILLLVKFDDVLSVNCYRQMPHRGA